MVACGRGGLEVVKEVMGVGGGHGRGVCEFVANCYAHVDTDDVWRWIINSIARYTVSGAYRLLTARMPLTDHVPATFLWRKDVTLKVLLNVFLGIDCLLRQTCSVEAIFYLRLSCVLVLAVYKNTENHIYFCQVWQLVRKWLCVHSVDPSNIVDHFHQFNSFGRLLWYILCQKDSPLLVIYISF
jgi:hypothetical protein